MNKFLIVVEGVADIIFFRDYLISLYDDLSPADKIKKALFSLKSEVREIVILQSNGYHRIGEINKKIQEYIDLEYKVLVIQDADDNIKDKKNGGVVRRLEYLNNIKEKHNINFETFLFPNNNEDGDLETLLIKIVNFENYDKFCTCNINYKNEIDKISSEFSHELDENKYKVFHYFRTYYGAEKAKESNRTYEEKCWNLESDDLLPLKTFIITHLS